MIGVSDAYEEVYLSLMPICNAVCISEKRKIAFVSRIANWFIPEFIPESPAGAKRKYIKYHSTYALLKLIIKSFHRTDVHLLGKTV
jgi:hypothetical protein